MLGILLLLIGAILLWASVTGRLNTFWDALKNPLGTKEA